MKTPNNWIKTPTSSNVKRFGYVEEDRRLFVQFRHGGSYAYLNVPSDVFEDLQNAESKGKFINEHVKDNYEFTRF